MEAEELPQGCLASLPKRQLPASLIEIQYAQLKSKGSINQALGRRCQEARHFPVYTANVKMSVPPAASGGNISRSKTTQIPLLLAPKQMKTQQSSSCPVLVNMMCLLSLFGTLLLQFVFECQRAFKLCFLLHLERKWLCF